MIRQVLAPDCQIGDPDFAWRGGDVSRIESLSDAVFALALAMLFVSGAAPTNYGELEDAMLDFPALLVCFVFLLMPWWAHYKFFRRFGIQDLPITIVNTALLFLVLFYVYPLKFLSTSLFDSWFGFASGTELRERLSGSEDLMLIYSGGFAGIFACLAWLNMIGYRRREVFALTAIETCLVRSEILSHLIMVGVGLLSVAIALSEAHMMWAGMCYCIIGPLQFWRGHALGNTVERMQEDAA